MPPSPLKPLPPKRKWAKLTTAVSGIAAAFNTQNALVVQLQAEVAAGGVTPETLAALAQSQTDLAAAVAAVTAVVPPPAP